MKLFKKTLTTGALALMMFAALWSAQPAAAADDETDKLPQEVVALAKAYGDTPAMRDARMKVAKNFYENAVGIAGRFDGDSKGIDFSKPVMVMRITEGTQLPQFVRTGFPTIKPGNFFATTETAVPDCLGISGEGRALYKFQLPKGRALQSTAAPILDTWSNPAAPIQTKGGCNQLVVGNNMKDKAQTIGPVQAAAAPAGQ